MGYLHSIFLVLSGLSYLLVLLAPDSSYGGPTQAVEIALISMGGLLMGSLLLHKQSTVHARVLIIIQIIVVILSVFYYYFYWRVGAFSDWSGTREGRMEFIFVGLPPILGYIFLSLSVRTLTRKLRVLSRVDRLRG